MRVRTRSPVATMITGAQFPIHSQEEIQHTVMVAEQIGFLGGVPAVEVEKRQIAKNSLVILKQDLAERGA